MYKPIEDKLIGKYIVKDIGTFYYYQNFMISEINEGVNITINEVVNVTQKYTNKHYNNSIPFVFISNRVNSYSLEPTIHYQTKNMLPNTVGYGVVVYNDLNKKVANLEQNFVNIPSKIFKSLSAAVAWAEELIRMKD